jgi:Muniscin C-terminal mu homology domain
VKADGGFCRVALQISSNPNNEANLTDLTIVMGVPESVLGETLLTQPAGGVWEKSKSAVIWCVSELGSGEKFQLQARFEMKKEATTEDVQFPVIVRCQCLDVQLTGVEFDVRENAEQFPADIVLNVARRFRLSHREKHN